MTPPPVMNLRSEPPSFAAPAASDCRRMLVRSVFMSVSVGWGSV